MKTWLLALIGFTLIILLGLFSMRYLDQSSRHLDMQISQIDQKLTKREWSRANQQLRTLNNHWRQAIPVWAVFIHHQEIDNIENALVRLDKAIQSHDYSGSKMSSGELRHFLQHIPQREDFTIINIL